MYRFEITHTTVYQYSEPVVVSHNLLHLAPRTQVGQRVLSFALDISPRPAVTDQRPDYFGNRIDRFTVQDAHRSLSIRATSVVLRDTPRALCDDAREGDRAWEACLRGYAMPEAGSLPAGRAAQAAAADFISDSALVTRSQECAAFARPSFPPGRPLLAGARDLSHRIYRSFTYDQQATVVSTPLAEVMRMRRGVCQDFAHIAIACLRSLGIAARYVSGYLATEPLPGVPRLVGADASHAWFSIQDPDLGWVDFDPTNDCQVGDRHAIVAVGRDFSDVSPVKGMILGGGVHQVSVGVDVRRTRIDDEPDGDAADPVLASTSDPDDRG